MTPNASLALASTIATVALIALRTCYVRGSLYFIVVSAQTTRRSDASNEAADDADDSAPFGDSTECFIEALTWRQTTLLLACDVSCTALAYWLLGVALRGDLSLWLDGALPFADSPSPPSTLHTALLATLATAPCGSLCDVLATRIQLIKRRYATSWRSLLRHFVGRRSSEHGAAGARACTLLATLARDAIVWLTLFATLPFVRRLLTYVVVGNDVLLAAASLAMASALGAAASHWPWTRVSAFASLPSAYYHYTTVVALSSSSSSLLSSASSSSSSVANASSLTPSAVVDCAELGWLRRALAAPNSLAATRFAQHARWWHGAARIAHVALHALLLSLWLSIITRIASLSSMTS